jgi:hypothetical protein
MEPVKIKPRVIKSVVKKNDPVTMADGTPYIPLKVETQSDAMRACLHMILKHTADMFVTICEIVAEEYKMDSEAVVNTIRNSPRFEKLVAEDVLLTTAFFDKQEAPVAPVPVVEAEAEAPAPVPVEEKPKKKPRAPKAVPPVPLVPVEEVVAPVLPKEEPAPVSQPKKVKVRVVSKVKA